MKLSQAQLQLAALGRTIERRIVLQGLSSRKLAQEAGITVPMLSAVCTGSTAVPGVVYGAVADALDVRLSILLDESKQRRPQPDTKALTLDEIAKAIMVLPTKGSKVEQVIAATVLYVFEAADCNQSAAARRLGMERKAFIRRLAKARRGRGRK